MIKIGKRCPLCGETSLVEVPEEGYKRYREGAFVQDAFPELSVGERETIISGSHSKCFDDAFGEDDDEDSEMDADDYSWDPTDELR